MKIKILVIALIIGSIFFLSSNGVFAQDCPDPLPALPNPYPRVGNFRLCLMNGSTEVRCSTSDLTISSVAGTILKMTFSYSNITSAKVVYRPVGGSWIGWLSASLSGGVGTMTFPAPTGLGNYQVAAAGYTSDCNFSCSTNSYYTGDIPPDGSGSCGPAPHVCLVGGGCSNATIALHVVTPTNTPTPMPTSCLPYAPANFNATDGSYNDRINLSWNPVSGTSWYRIYKAYSSGGSYTYCGSTTATSITDTGNTWPACPGMTTSSCTRYYYAVDAVFGSGACNSNKSENPGYADLCAAAPAAPSNLSIVGPQYGSPLNLVWKDNATNEQGFYVYNDGIKAVPTISCWQTGSCAPTSVPPNTSSSDYQWPSYKDYTFSGGCGSIGNHTLEVSAFCNACFTGTLRESSKSSAQSVCSATGTGPITSVSWSTGGVGPATIDWTYTPPSGVLPNPPNSYFFVVYKCNLPPNIPVTASVCNSCNSIFTSDLPYNSSSPVDDTPGINSTNTCYKVRVYTNVCPYPCVTPTPTPTCAPVCPSPAPVLSDPTAVYDRDLRVCNATLSWSDVSSWGSVCPPATQNNQYTIYISDTADSDLTDNTLLVSPALQTGETTEYVYSNIAEGDYYAQIKADSGEDSCNVLSNVVAFTCDSSYSPWFQTEGGSLHGQGIVFSNIPACATSLYLSKNNSGGSAGVVSWLTGSSIGLGEGEVSEANWQANISRSSLLSKSYTYFLNRFQVDTSADTFTGEMPSESGTYYSSVGRSLTGSFPSGEKIILFVNGNVTVQEDIVVPEGSFFALIANGDISFSGTNPNVVRNAQGFFLANGTIIVQNTTGNNQNFEGQGSFVGLSGISFERDLGAGNQNCNPAEIFIERPDFFINSPSSFKIISTYYKEIAP